ncbi:MAG TPA: ABC-F family ATP-binding cassette domain-containing protein [Polyangiaceae bacterium]|jgi:ATP-binding cassette subfamily F protein uup|nr:ABC-F family ATP-binding cassette domain-containing protein [Polyangiaceae bacterium]
MSVVSARGVSKSYGSQTLLADVSLTIEPGDRIGLLGANGAGKSTLLRMLAGLEAPDVGTLDRARDAKILYLPQEPVLDPDATPRRIVEEGLAEWHRAARRHAEISRELESVTGAPVEALLAEQATLGETIEHLGGWSRDHVASEMLERLGVREPDRPVGTMSGGERRRVALARLLVSEPALAILDEPTNHLDTDTIEWLEGYLANEFKGAVLMVTHDRYVLDRVAARVFELEGGAILEFSGGYTGYIEQKAELVEHLGRVESNRLNLLRRERAWLQRGAKARSTKQKARRDRAEALVAETAPREAGRVELGGLDVGAPRTGKTILDFEDVGLSIGGRELVRGLTLHMVTGDRIGILGPNGAGKTSLLRVASGELAATSGKVTRGLNTNPVHFDQARAGLIDGWSVFDNVAEREGADRGAADVVRIGDTILEMRSYLERFLFEGIKQRQKVGSLSGGERARVALAKALRSGANLLLLDEPTNDLDVHTLASLEELLVGWPGCALVVSHDRYFLDRVATSILVLEGGGAVARYPGGYESYRSLKGQADAEKKEEERAKAGASKAEKLAPAVSAAVPAPARAVESLRALSFAERKELDGLLEEITTLETRAGELEAKLASPALYAAGPEASKAAQAEYTKAKDELVARTARWEHLESRRDAKRR